MPQGLVRLHDQNDTHFITFSCYQRRPYLSSPELRDTVEDALERTRSRYRFCVFGYVIMPEHVHALFTEPKRATVADVTKAWKLSVTLRQPLRPFWEDRYYDFNVYTERKRIEKLRYLHRNPVTRGLVRRANEWAWSSFEHYATGKRRVVEVESEWTVCLRAAFAQQPGSENPDPGHPVSDRVRATPRPASSPRAHSAARDWPGLC